MDMNMDEKKQKQENMCIRELEKEIKGKSNQTEKENEEMGKKRYFPFAT